MGKTIEEYHWILASGSPRRRELLKQIGIDAMVLKSDADEDCLLTDPGELVIELSKRKARDVSANAPDGSVVLGADTVVSIDGRILGKPLSHEEASDMIRSLMGRTHQVYTGVTMILKDEEEDREVSFAEKTDVTVSFMTDEEIAAYAETEEPMDKAGAYAIQGIFAKYVSKINGDYSNVVGLPVSAVYQNWKKLTGV